MPKNETHNREETVGIQEKRNYVAAQEIQLEVRAAAEGGESRTIFKFHCVSINILAIRLYQPLSFIFKFHCVSINIGLLRLLPQSFIFFKFHCVSINIELFTANRAGFNNL